jgi:hypothetical protein
MTRAHSLPGFPQGVLAFCNCARKLVLFCPAQIKARVRMLEKPTGATNANAFLGYLGNPPKPSGSKLGTSMCWPDSLRRLFKNETYTQMLIHNCATKRLAARLSFRKS